MFLRPLGVAFYVRCHVPAKFEAQTVPRIAPSFTVIEEWCRIKAPKTSGPVTSAEVTVFISWNLNCTLTGIACAWNQIMCTNPNLYILIIGRCYSCYIPLHIVSPVLFLREIKIFDTQLKPVSVALEKTRQRLTDHRFMLLFTGCAYVVSRVLLVFANICIFIPEICCCL